MATEGVGNPTLDDASNPADGQTAESHLVGPEHISVLMLIVVVGAIMSDRLWAWPAATIVVSVAYLYVFLQFRRTSR